MRARTHTCTRYSLGGFHLQLHGCVKPQKHELTFSTCARAHVRASPPRERAPYTCSTVRREITSLLSATVSMRRGGDDARGKQTRTHTPTSPTRVITNWKIYIRAKLTFNGNMLYAQDRTCYRRKVSEQGVKLFVYINKHFIRNTRVWGRQVKMFISNRELGAQSPSCVYWLRVHSALKNTANPNLLGR